MKKIHHILITIVCISVVVLSFVAVRVFDIKDMTTSKGEIVNYNDGWTLKRPDGSELCIDELPYSEPSKAGEIYYLNKTISKDDAGKAIRFLSADKIISVSLDGTVIYEFGVSDKRSFGKTPGSITNFVEIPHDFDKGELSMMMVSPYDNYATNICAMVIGETNVVELDLVKQNLFNYFILVIIFFSALMLIVMEIIDLISKQKFSGKLYLGGICFLGAIYHAIETKSLSLFYGNQTLYSIMVFLVIMVLPQLLCLYYMCNVDEKYNKRFRINFDCCVANMAIQIVLQVLNVADFMVLAPLSHLMIFITVINVDYTIIKINIDKYKESKELHAGSISEMIGVTSIMLGSLIDIVRFYITPVGDMGKYGRIGMLIFSVIILSVHIRRVSERYLGQVKRNIEMMKEHISEIENASKKKSLFLANMSHEIRTPMNSILGFSEILLKQSVNDEQRELVENIRESSDNLLSIINDILDISKIETGKLEIVEREFNTKVLIKSVIKQIKILAEKKNLKLKTNISSAIPSKLLGDDVRIREILINLLNNAVKYTKEGFVSLNVSVDEPNENRITLRMVIEDSGIGIPKKNLDLIFHAFEQSDTYKNHDIEGTGLGLYIVRTYIELMGGSIHVDSVLDKGSVFSVDIPLEIIDSKPVGEINFDEEETPVSRIGDIKVNKKVLAVDDSIVNLKVLEKALTNYGVTVETADNGLKALEKCKEEVYDIVFMDQMMPGMDGVETMHKIREISGYETGSETKIYVITANAIKGTEEALINEGFDGYLKKPIEFDKLELALLCKL